MTTAAEPVRAPVTDHVGDWDLTPIFPALASTEFTALRHTLTTTAHAALTHGQGNSPLVAALSYLHEADAAYQQVSSYLHCLSTQAQNPPAVQAIAGLDDVKATLDKAWSHARRRIAALNDDAFEELCAEPALAGVRYTLERARARAQRTMSTELEALAADLAPTALRSWGRLYDELSGGLTFTLAVPGRAPAQHPISMTRTFIEDGDPAVREAAFRGAGQAWSTIATSCNAALNGLAGTRLVLADRRGEADFLEAPLFDAGISRKTLEAMMEAVRARQEVPRRYLRAKAKRLGQTDLAFWDLSAPLPGGGDARISYEEGWQRIHRAFAKVPALADLAARAEREHWVDWQTRAGKRPGGYCTGFPLTGVSRIFMTFHGALGDLSTLAHELGHAFHTWVMRDMPAWAQDYPMTLAETASTFAEELMVEALMDSPEVTPAERAQLIDARLEASAAFLLNIPMRFDFEREFYRRRMLGEVGVDECCELMRETQRAHYGDALRADTTDPWFWAAKLHYYISDVSFYNFPYTFGYLFSKGIYARFVAEGPAFVARYVELLRATGTAGAEAVARQHLGVDLETPAFWHQAIDLIERELVSYEAATPA